MKDHYDFSKMKSKKNPYVRLLKQPVTLRLDRDSMTHAYPVHCQKAKSDEDRVN
jgi:hypothetical protein